MLRKFICVGIALVGLGGQAVAQAVPNTGSVLRDIQRGIPELTKPAEPTTPLAPEVEEPAVKSGQTILLKDFRIHASLFPEATLKDVVKEYIGRDVSLSDLEEAAAMIGRYYREHGYLARAYLPKQTIRDGVVEITVLEGKLGQVSVDPGTKARLSPDIAVGNILAQQNPGDYLRPGALADGIANLNALPGVATSATLVPGAREGETDLLLKVDDTPLVTGAVTGDNGSPRAIGRWRTTDSLAINDALGLGDMASVAVLKSQGAQLGALSLQAPVGYSGLTLGGYVESLKFITDKKINFTEPGGMAVVQGLSATYPLFRNDEAVFQAKATYDHKRLVNQIMHITTADNGVNVVGLGSSGTIQDELLGQGGVTTLGGIASVGRVDLDQNPDNLATDLASAHTQGTYSKFTGNLGRVQPLSADDALALNLSGQWTHKNLDASEQFALGGSTAVRSYPVNEATGDKGWVASAELRHNLLSDVQVAGFYDIGGITLHAEKWTDWQGGGNQPNSYILQGTGVWASWNPLASVTIKGTMAQVLGENAGRTADGYNSDGTRYRTLFWLQASALF